MTRPLRPAPFRTGTALDRYERLEAVGRWRESPGAEPREVIVAFGSTSLVLSDGAETTLGHWALSGIRALGRDGDATLYAMTPEGYETLAIRDPDMIAAIDAVSAAARGFPGAAPPSRRWPWAVALVLVAIVGLRFASPLVEAQAARMVVPGVAEGLGDELLLRLLETRGPLCADAAGAEALGRLAGAAAAGAGPEPRVRLLDLDTPVAVLPGGLVLLDRGLLATADGPEELAGWIVLGLELARADPPATTLMAAAGPLASLRYILTGALPEQALARAAAAAVAPSALPSPALADLAVRLQATGIPAEPLAAGLRRTGAGPAADALLASAAPSAALPETGADLLSDLDWAALDRLCR